MNTNEGINIPHTPEPPEFSIINIADIAEVGRAPDGANPPPEADPPHSPAPTRRLRVREYISLFFAAVGCFYCIYRSIPLTTHIAVSRDVLLSVAMFGSVFDSESTDTDSSWANGDFPSTLPPLSHTLGGASPFGFDDASLSDMLYSASPPECGEDEYPIKAVDLSVDAKNGLYASNETSYTLDLQSYLDDELGIASVSALAERYGDDAPVVLIVHTHGTECYTDEGSGTYTKKDNCRTDDTSKNVVAVGAVMAEYFNSVGIPTLHCTEMFDKDSYIDAYDLSAAAIREFTAIYPSIQYVFDVHRDSVIDSELTKLRPVTVIDGKPTSQYMCVVGTNERNPAHEGWETNLAFACQLQSRLWQTSPSLTRRMSIRSAPYNQRWASGSLLLEIGSCGNTLTEAKNCAYTVAEHIAEIILEQ